AVAFYALCMGIFYARPNRGVMLELLGPGVGSVVARRLLPAAFFVPILLGWLRTLGRNAGLFGQGFGTAAFVVLMILLFAGLIRWTVIAINRQEAERKRAEVALRRSEANLRDFVDHATVGLHWVGPDGIIIWANQAELDMLGYTSEEYIGHAITEFHADEEVITDILRRLVQGESLHEHEARLHCKDGTIRHVLINSNARFEDGRFIHTRCFTRDITESRTAEAAQARLAAIVTSCNDGILSKSLDGTITTWNPGAEKIFGYTAEEMVGQPVMRLIPPERASEEAEILAKLTAGVQIDHYETERVGKDGRRLPVSLTLSLIHGPGGTIVGASKIVRDITDRKKAENELRESKERAEAASRAKDDFLAALSHELRTPLTPVLMMATALGDDPTLPAAVREQLAMMRRNVELEARLIDDLLDLTRINRGKLVIAPVTADVHQLLGYTAEIVLSDRLGKDVSILFKNEAARHHVLADPTRLQQVFWNLIKNAIKFTPAGGSITVSTHNDDEGRIVLSVADTGVGISAEALPHIFKAFEQGDATGQHRYGGLGLGLAISQAIMEAHGGSITVSSAGTGQGAVFTVALATVEAPADAAQDGAGRSGTARALRLLIVEDHVTTRTVLAQLLTRSGHHITTAGDSREALRAYAAGTFDAVISDLGLPDGSGLELMREIQKVRPVPAIALSGYGMEDDLRLTKDAGFFAHLVKPVNLDQLRHLIGQIGPGK
ncbi:MAG: domain S-box, partial [Prosthecobacter sp.]|nr:domain S-box [Prosthecobacter sp.]